MSCGLSRCRSLSHRFDYWHDELEPAWRGDVESLEAAIFRWRLLKLHLSQVARLVVFSGGSGWLGFGGGAEAAS